jgi:hypothetical protein
MLQVEGLSRVWIVFTVSHPFCHWACLDGGVSVSLKQTNTKTNTFHPNTCVSLVLVGTNTPQKPNTSKRW